MTWADALPYVAAIVGTSGLAGGIALLLRVRPEAGQAYVVASKGALLVQTGVIERLEAENRRLGERIEALEARETTAEGLQGRVDELEAENHTLKGEAARLKLRVGELEALALEQREEIDNLKRQANGTA